LGRGQLKVILLGDLVELETRVATRDQAIAGLITAFRELAAPTPPKQTESPYRFGD